MKTMLSDNKQLICISRSSVRTQLPAHPLPETVRGLFDPLKNPLKIAQQLSFGRAPEAWIKIKRYKKGSFVSAVIPNPPASGSTLGALLVGVNENGKFKFAGRVGTGFSDKLLKALWLELNKIAVKACPFYNLPATGRGLDPGLTVADMKLLHLA